VCGTHDAFDLLTVDQRVLCATHYHGIASRLKEMARGNNPRGTIGTGIGEAYRYSQRFPELDIRAGDLARSDLKDLLAAVRDRVLLDLDAIIHGEFLPEDRDEARREIDLLYDEGFLEFIAKRFLELSQKAKIVDPGYLGREILSKDGAVVVESSHGILTDHFHGFFPHVSAIRTLPRFTHAMLHEAGYDGRIVNIGVSRAYAIRHGAGPMPTDDPSMAQRLLPGSHKVENRYQGKVRVGPMDLMLLRYAIEVCGGPTAFDGLAITWFDQIQANGTWHISENYSGNDDRAYFSPSGEIKVRRSEDNEQLEHQEALGKQLLHCKAVVTSCEVPKTAGRDDLFSLCASVLREKLNVPVRMVSFGPTERDKTCK
jgi:adenylosuccinate synthase